MAKTSATCCDRCRKEVIGFPSNWGTINMARPNPFLQTGPLDLCDTCFSTVYSFVRKPAMDPPLTAAFKQGSRETSVDPAERAKKMSGIRKVREDLVLVHTDGGPCHGYRIVASRCTGCNIFPDMQSTEMWPPEDAKG